jgi:hypothetical protein
MQVAEWTVEESKIGLSASVEMDQVNAAGTMFVWEN